MPRALKNWHFSYCISLKMSTKCEHLWHLNLAWLPAGRLMQVGQEISSGITEWTKCQYYEQSSIFMTRVEHCIIWRTSKVLWLLFQLFFSIFSCHHLCQYFYMPTLFLAYPCIVVVLKHCLNLFDSLFFPVSIVIPIICIAVLLVNQRQEQPILQGLLSHPWAIHIN